MLDIMVAADALLANIEKIRQQALEMPNGGTVSDYDGTKEGIGQVYGQALANAGITIANTLSDIKHAMAENADALKAALTQLSGTDELSAQDATTLIGMIDDAVAANATSEAPAAPIVRQPGGMISN
jgi:hypothetical protein